VAFINKPGVGNEKFAHKSEAASLAKYVKITLAPARLMAINDSIMARSPSSQPS
jgi:hypothetical protein